MFQPTRELPPTRTAGDTGHTNDHALLRAALDEVRQVIPNVPSDIGAASTDALAKLALVPAVSKTTSATLALSDAASAVEVSSSSDATITVPTNTSVAFPIGTVIEVVRLGSGAVTLAAASGVTLLTSASLTLRAVNSAVTLRKRATNVWHVAGDLT